MSKKSLLEYLTTRSFLIPLMELKFKESSVVKSCARLAECIFEDCQAYPETFETF